MKKLFLLFLPLLINAQDVPIGYWKDYQSYTSASYIAEADNKIYCVTNGGLFYVNKDDNTVNRMSKVTGLSDVGVKQIAYDIVTEITIITYENCNIDLIKNNQIINISDIKRKEITGLKSINNITVKGEVAYLSTTFGLVLVDLDKEEIKDTYPVEKNGNVLEINDCAIISDIQILIATSLGLYVGDVSSVLNDPANWLLYGIEMAAINVIRNDSIGCILYHDGNDDDESYLDIFYPPPFNIPLFSDPGLKKITYTNGVLQKIYNDHITLTNNGINMIVSINDPKIVTTNYSISDSENTVWIADSANGLLKFTNSQYQENYIPEGPIRNDIYSLEYEDNTLYMCHGGHANFGTNSLINDGVSYKNTTDTWINNNRSEIGGARDILEVAVKDGYAFYASWYHGISKMNDEYFIEKYDYNNTNGVLDTVYYSNNRIRISDLKFDNDGNLWGLSSEVNHPLFVKTKNDQWFSFNMNQNKVGLYFDDLIIDQYNQKWGVIGRLGGLFVYDDNNTISDPSDDQYKTLRNTVGQGNLPSMGVYSIAEDLDGEIWVGTDKGIGIFYNPSAIFSENNFDAQQILITEGEYGQYLLSEEKVKCITIDGANRKWIGTEKSGVFLISDDGMEEILHFTTNNSPLFSDNIYDITINPSSGEVFIGTAKGLISYRSDAIKGVTTQSTTKVFPNPVRETYNGIIAISGLVADANIKIADIDGNLVFEGFAKGGQASWNGKNKNGDRVSTGVYLVFSTDMNGLEKIVSKILFIN